MGRTPDHSGKISKHDVALEEVRLKYEFRLAIVHGATTIASILSFGVPLYFVYLAIGALAGQKTIVSPSFAATVVGMVGGGSALTIIGSGRAKSAKQKRELIRTRERADDLESKLRRFTVAQSASET